jgi:hypothetical protein
MRERTARGQGKGREKGERGGRGGRGSGAGFSDPLPLDSRAPPCYHGGRRRGERRGEQTGAARREPGQSRFCSPHLPSPWPGVNVGTPGWGRGGCACGGARIQSGVPGPVTVCLLFFRPPIWGWAEPSGACPAPFLLGFPRVGGGGGPGAAPGGEFAPCRGRPAAPGRPGAEADGPPSSLSAPGAGEEPPVPPRRDRTNLLGRRGARGPKAKPRRRQHGCSELCTPAHTGTAATD